MRWIVTSKRLAWPAGTELSRQELASCNITALEDSGHLTRVTRKKPPAPAPEEE